MTSPYPCTGRGLAPSPLLLAAAILFLHAGQPLRGETNLLVTIEDGFARVEIDRLEHGRAASGFEAFCLPPGAELLEYGVYRARGPLVRGDLVASDVGVDSSGGGPDRVTLESNDWEIFVAQFHFAKPPPFLHVRLVYSLALEVGRDAATLRLPLWLGWVGPPAVSRFRVEVRDRAPIGRIATVPDAGVEIVRDGPHRFTVDWRSPVARGEPEFVLCYARPLMEERLDLFTDENGVGYFRLLLPRSPGEGISIAATEGLEVQTRPRWATRNDGVLELHGRAERSGRVSLVLTERGRPWSRSFRVELPLRPGGEPALRGEWFLRRMESAR